MWHTCCQTGMARYNYWYYWQPMRDWDVWPRPYVTHIIVTNIALHILAQSVMNAFSVVLSGIRFNSN